MSGLTGVLMGRMLSAYFRHPGSAALAAVAVIGLGASGWLGFGYMHYQRLIVARETMLQHLESANLDLQDTLKQLRDEIQMNRDEAVIERDWLRARVSELEQKLSLPQRANGRRPKAAVTPLEQRRQVAAVGSSASGVRNFVPPGWVPDYFSNESGSSVGNAITPGRDQR